MRCTRPPRILHIIPFLLTTVVLFASAHGKVIYVDGDAAGANDGATWADAYVYLQDALADANDSEKPVEIRVAQGTYKPDQGADMIPGDREASFRFGSGVIIKGGYHGGSEELGDARDILLYESILSGDLMGDDLRVDDPSTMLKDPNRADNSHHVATIPETDMDVVIDGFTIIGGHADSDTPLTRGGGGPSPLGGGMRNGGNPTLSNCTFAGNLAREGGAMSTHGGTPTLTDCVFHHNLAYEGGAVSTYAGTPTLTGCVFHHNVAYERRLFLPDGTVVPMYGHGGAIYAQSGMILDDCKFYSNLAASGGGMHVYGRNDLALAHCEFSDNRATRVGGGIHVDGGIRNVFWNNTSLTGCLFRRNSAGLNGGAIFSMTGVFTLTRCLFSGNSADQNGGAIYTYGTDLALYNCTTAGNRSLKGNALVFKSFVASPRAVQLMHCILWGSGNQIATDDGIHLTAAYSDILGGWPGEGNIDVNPLFASPCHWDPNATLDDPNDDFFVEGDYHLKSQAERWDEASESWVIDDVTSPCIDAGDPNSPVACEPFPNGAIINMGAYGGTAEASKSPTGLHARYGGGTGEPNDPYLIYTAEHLNALGAEPNDCDKHFKLMADIDLSGYSYDRALIAPDANGVEDGFQGTRFTGSFDGSGHTISHLTIAGESYLGLFGQLGSDAEITDLGLDAVNVTGTGSYVGGLAGDSYGRVTVSHSAGTISGVSILGGLLGRNCGTVAQCRSAGEVRGTGSDAGGLVGVNWPGGDLKTCYSTALVSGGERVGGLAGANVGKVIHCYSTGSVSGSDDWVGGLVGSKWYRDGDWVLAGAGAVTDSFWDIETSGQAASAGGTGRATAEMQIAGTFLDAGWDFIGEEANGSEDIWWIDEGQDHPCLWWEAAEE